MYQRRNARQLGVAAPPSPARRRRKPGNTGLPRRFAQARAAKIAANGKTQSVQPRVPRPGNMLPGQLPASGCLSATDIVGKS
ncbi:hypothetical protein OH687_33255 [Burkholderia anthina]|nr:hypothetical protein OH687_33255 [Burkholderia anthina]